MEFSGYDNMEMGKRLQFFREQSNVTQKEMAEACSLSKNYISALERGVNKCSVPTLIGYCKKLDVTPNELLGFWDPDIIIELRNVLSGLDKKRQLKVLKMVQALLD